MTKQTTATIAKTATTLTAVTFVVGVVVREMWKPLQLAYSNMMWTSSDTEYSVDAIEAARSLAHTWSQLTDATFIVCGFCAIVAIGAWFGTASRNK